MKFAKLGGVELMHISFLLLMISTALRPAEKYLGNAWYWIPYLVIASALIALVASQRWRALANLIGNRGFQWSIVGLLALVSVVFYPAADALKQINQGQDQDDCTILGVEALAQFANPVSTPTYFGNPCSNLLGAILPHTPFVLLGNMGLAGPTFLAIGIWFLHKTSVDARTVGLMLAILTGIPATLELMVNGSDFVFMGVAIMVVARLLHLMSNGVYRDSKWIWTVALLTALVGTTRINMILFIAAVGLVQIALRVNLWPLISASILALFLNLAVYLSDPDSFAPLHLVAKGQSLVPGILYLVMLGTTVCIFLIGLIRPTLLRAHPQEFLLAGFGTHLLFLAFGDLAFNRVFDFFWWEGANYLYLLTPMVVLLASSSLTKKTPKDMKEAHAV